MQLYLIRHTQPEVPAGVCYGQSDLSLASNYISELSRLKKHFESHDISRIYTSPLKRCQQLAQDLFSSYSISDERLREINFGLWEMQKWDLLPKELIDEWTDDLINFRPPEGESLNSLNQRVFDFYQEELHQTEKLPIQQCINKNAYNNVDGDKVVLVTHGGVIRTLLCQLMNLPITANLQWQIDCGSVTKVNIEQGRVMVCYSNRLV